jgi:hypothetical protein
LTANDTGFVNESKFANMSINSPRGNAGHEITVMDNAIILNPVPVPELAVADPG